MRDIGKNIKDLRSQKNLTQDELAEKLFVTRQTVSNYETGRSRPDVEMLAKIADVLDTDANTVIYGMSEDIGRKKKYTATAIGAAMILLLILPINKPLRLMYILYFLLGAHPDIFSINFAYLLLPVGCLLWLCNFPKRKR